MFLFFLIVTLILFFIIVITILHFRNSFSIKIKLILLGIILLFIVSAVLTAIPLFVVFPNINSAYKLINPTEENYAVVYGEQSAIIILSNEQQYGFLLKNDQWKISNPYFGTRCIGRTHWVGDLIGSVTQIKGDDGIYLVLSGVETPSFTVSSITDSTHSEFVITRNESFFTMATYIAEWPSNYTLYVDSEEVDMSVLTSETQKTVQWNDNQFYTFLLNGILIVAAVALVTRKMLKNKKRRGSQENVNYNNMRD